MKQGDNALGIVHPSLSMDMSDCVEYSFQINSTITLES